MKKSSFFPSLGLLIILNLLVKPIWIFGIDRQVQNEVGTAGYGLYFSLLGLSVLFNFLLDWGLTVYFNRQLASDPENFTGRAGSFILVKILFAALYCILVLVAASIAGIERWDILILVILIQVLTSMFVFLRNIVTARQWFRLDAWLSVLDKSLMILICGGFLYFPLTFGRISLMSFLYTQLICTALAVFITVILLSARRIEFSIKKPFPGKQVFIATLPYAIIVLLMSAHYRADAFLLERLHENGAHEAGIYAGAYRLLEAANMVGFLFASFLLPYIANQLSNRKSIDKIVLNSRHLLIVFSIFVSISFIFQAPLLHALLYTSTSEYAVRVMQWCLPVLIPYSLVNIYGTLLTAGGKIIPFCYILLVSVAVNIIANLWFIPRWGALGCCYSALLSQGVCGISAMIYCCKKSAVNYHFRSILIYIFIGLLIAAMYYICRNMSVSHWLLIAFTGLFTLALSIHFKLLDIKLWQNNALNKEE